MLTIRRILHPTDFSDLSRPAFELACSLARDFGARLVVCHITPPPVAAVVEGMVVDVPAGESEQTRTRLEQVKPTDTSIKVVHRLEVGDAVREIVRLADEVCPLRNAVHFSACKGWRNSPPRVSEIPALFECEADGVSGQPATRPYLRFHRPARGWLAFCQFSMPVHRGREAFPLGRGDHRPHGPQGLG